MKFRPKLLRFPIMLLAGMSFASLGPAPGADSTPPRSNRDYGGYLGISYRLLTPDEIRDGKVSATTGALITGVVAPGPAADAMVAIGDVFIELDGKAIPDAAGFESVLKQLRPGNSIAVKFFRAGQAGTTTITLGEAPPAVAFFRRGAEKAGSGDQPGAIADYSESIRLNPRYFPAYLNRGWAKANSGDRPGAIADYTEAIRLNPQYFQAYLNRGIAKADSGDRSGAIADYSEAIRLEPRNAVAYLNRGLARTNSTQAGGQKLSRKEAAAAQKRSAEAMTDYTEAYRLYTEAIRLNPDNILAYEHRAIARDHMGDKAGGNQDRAAAAKIKEQVAIAKFRQEITAASLTDLFVSGEKSEAQARERNRAIIAAKNQQLPAILRETSTDELSAFVVKLEQTILDLNHESEVAKDRAQQAMANNGNSDQIEELRGLTISYRERIELLKPILSALKEEIANRSR